jgi:hypothetical protein
MHLLTPLLISHYTFPHTLLVTYIMYVCVCVCLYYNVVVALTLTLTRSLTHLRRGPGAAQAWECLEVLQRTAPEGSEVIRLVGNHGKTLLTLTQHCYYYISVMHYCVCVCVCACVRQSCGGWRVTTMTATRQWTHQRYATVSLTSYEKG